MFDFQKMQTDLEKLAFNNSSNHTLKVSYIGRRVINDAISQTKSASVRSDGQEFKRLIVKLALANDGKWDTILKMAAGEGDIVEEVGSGLGDDIMKFIRSRDPEAYAALGGTPVEPVSPVTVTNVTPEQPVLDPVPADAAPTPTTAPTPLGASPSVTAGASPKGGKDVSDIAKRMSSLFSRTRSAAGAVRDFAASPRTWVVGGTGAALGAAGNMALNGGNQTVVIKSPVTVPSASNPAASGTGKPTAKSGGSPWLLPAVAVGSAGLGGIIASVLEKRKHRQE